MDTSDEKELVYKYSAWTDYCKKGLKDRTFWFSKPTEFNDPFDCNIDVFDKSLLNPSDFTTVPDLENRFNEFKDRLRTILSEMGVLCLTRKGDSVGINGYDNMHLWSLYADSHKGISLGFNKKLIEKLAYDLVAVESSLLDVNYVDTPIDLTNIEVDCICPDEEGSICQKKHIISLIDNPYGKNIINLDKIITKNIVLRKDPKIWQNENECRIVLSQNAFHKAEICIPNSLSGYAIPYPEGDVLEEVTFGANFDDKSSREEVISIISKYHNNVRFYKATIDYGTNLITREEINCLY